MSRIESFFQTSVLETKVDGRTFDPDDKDDDPGKYGKMTFATRVVEPNAATIDFSGFAPLLERFVAVLDHHAALKAGS